MIRRTFLKHIAIGVSVVALPFQIGCSVWTNIKHWVPVGIQAFDAILNLLIGAGVIAVITGNPIMQIAGQISAGFSVIAGAIDAYLSTNPPPVGALAKIEDILTELVGNFQTFLSSLMITDTKLSALVTGLADVILSTIAGFQAQLPMAAAAAQRPFKVGAGGQMRQVAIQKRSIHKFASDFNALMTGYGYKPAIHLSWKERFE